MKGWLGIGSEFDFIIYIHKPGRVMALILAVYKGPLVCIVAFNP